MSPQEHGEIFLLPDKTECDLDIGHQERITGTQLSYLNICTSGTLYKQLLQNDEEGKYLGKTVQSDHLIELIIKRLEEVAKDKDIVVCEIGGSVGDQESSPFFETIRKMKQKYVEDCMVIMVAPVIYVKTVEEFKTKPLQKSVRDVHSFGFAVDALLCRSETSIPVKILDKISDTTGVPREAVFECCDVKSIYQVPIEFYKRHVDDLIVDKFRLKRNYCKIHKYREIVEEYMANNLPIVEVGIVCKYSNPEAYLSVKEAIFHAGLANHVKCNINWIMSESYSKEELEVLDAVIVPGGFDIRGVDGKIAAIKYARENKIPFLGICLGLQCSVIEFAKNVCKIKDANSMEFEKATPNPVVYYIEGQENIKKKSGTLRLGAYDCDLEKDSLAFDLYKKKSISERHRHRLEVNPKYLDEYKVKGFKVSGVNPGSNLVEIMELDREIHPYFIATQAHPEFKSRLIEPHPLFKGLVAAAITYNTRKNTKDQ
jgi:CTP synthase